jgi:cytochrome c oxidase subunit 3
MKDFARFKKFQTITILCALAFLGIKSYEYHDKFSHYAIDAAPGVVVHVGEGKEAKDVTLVAGDSLDGHLLEQDTNKVVIHGHIVNAIEAAKVTHAWQQREIVNEEITIKRGDVGYMENYGPWHSTYMAIYFTLTGLHALHVIGGALVIGFIWGPGAVMWKSDPERYTNRVEVSGLFWHFVDLVWIFLFPVLYLL